jgi:ElaB/YqjD/DUF883 family membrane-anchored ribosome-binding protein
MIMSATADNLAQKAQGAAGKAADMTIRKVGARAKATANQGFDAIGDIADQARDMAANATDSVVSYTKKNPLTALAIAAASGAVLYAALKTYRSFRD